MRTAIFITAFFILSAVTTHAQTSKPALDFTTARKVMEGCVAFADSAKLRMAVAVYDAHAQLVSFAKMDGASVGTAKVAQWKGLSASTYQYPTTQTATWNVPNAPDIATVAGGVTIYTHEGQFIGAVGVSGAAASVDAKCAEAGVIKAGLAITARKD